MTKLLRVLGWPAFRNRKEQPYNALLYSAMQRRGVEVAEASLSRLARGRYDILHLHWPDLRVRAATAARAILRSASYLARVDLARARGMNIVWTVHNLVAHEGVQRPWLEDRYWDALARRLDALISMSESGVDAVRERHPAMRETAVFVIPMGHFRGVYQDVVTREQARETLGIPGHARVISFIGQVREYKNIPQLVKAFRSLHGEDAVLLIAGKPRPESVREAIAAIARDDARIRLELRFIPDDEVQLYLRAADLVALSYRDILNSSTALLALSFDRPVLVPRKGAMSELERAAGDEWVRTYDGEISPQLLRDGLEWATAPDRPSRPQLADLDWDRIAGMTVDAFRQLAAGPTAR